MPFTQIVVHGQVQGVGFRATAKNIADQHQVKGWVKNTAYGAVEIEAEGDQEELDAFIGKIKDGPTPFAKVESVDIERKEELKGYKEFKIVH
ncbi:acylphosphatase [Halobacillus rhizosphaerae]|uniref:acylphosphatase n=1 Tax=Halobacillus rhizosphaerae TaxID=3064889 RepID=UPI00398AD97F